MRKSPIFATDSWVVYCLLKHSGNFGGNVNGKTHWLDRPQTFQTDKLENIERYVKEDRVKVAFSQGLSSMNEVL